MEPYENLPEVPIFSLTSEDLTADGVLSAPQRSKTLGVPEGQDLSPQLSWSGFPATTRSFVVTLFDPDAPTISGFWHWVVADIPASVTSLPVGAGTVGSPAQAPGLQLRNDGGFEGYLGAAPPVGHGPHRYIFTVHAVDVPTLGVEPGTTPASLVFALFGHELARATLVTHFGR